MTIISPENAKKWATNALVFFAPVLVIYLGAVADAINVDGFQWTDFVPNMVVAGTDRKSVV